MREQTSLTSNRTFSDTREYFQNSFFPKLKPFGIPKAIARHYDEEENPRTDGLLPFEPTVETDTPGHYVVVKSMGNRMFVRVDVQEDAKNVVLVTAECEAHLRSSGIVGGIVLSGLTCGLWALIWLPMLLFRHFSCQKYARSVADTLQADLGTAR